MDSMPRTTLCTRVLDKVAIVLYMAVTAPCRVRFDYHNFLQPRKSGSLRYRNHHDDANTSVTFTAWIFMHNLHTTVECASVELIFNKNGCVTFISKLQLITISI